VGIVHGLESDPGVIAVEVTIVDQILDRIDNLAYQYLLVMYAHSSAYLLQQVGLLKTCFKHYNATLVMMYEN